MLARLLLFSGAIFPVCGKSVVCLLNTNRKAPKLSELSLNFSALYW